MDQKAKNRVHNPFYQLLRFALLNLKILKLTKH
ncbi:MAG: hypothetical protein RLZ65_346 [Actinomycetota bacterium]|jgi:hypothetical protein